MTSPPSPKQPIASSDHRGDIDGLRAIAVTIVVAYHADIPGFRGGFVGVDVFFVISGFLIMGLLLKELSASGSLSLQQFWARRIRRLAPAMTAVILCTLVVAAFVLSPLRWHSTAVDGGWASVYLSNYAFALNSRGYFVQSTIPSPFLHMWSLAVEEQFYLLWPLFMVVLTRFAARARRSFMSLLTPVVVIGVIGSFGISYIMSERHSPWAYYSLPTRWWEIGLGIGAAMFCQRRQLRERWAPWVAVAGIASLVTAVITITPTTTFPGIAALLPTLGTAALLVAGASGQTWIARALGVAPLQALGRLSFSWYLWHWPAIVLTGAALRGASRPQLAWAAFAALILAWLTHIGIEQPVRFAKALTTSTRACFALGVGCIAAVGVMATLLSAAGQRELRDPYLASLDAAVRSRAADVETCSVDSCTSSPNAVMLIGDSHAAHWVPALEAASRELGLTLEVRTRGGCPPWGFSVLATGSDRPSPQCLAFVAETERILDSKRPRIVLLTSSGYGGLVAATNGRSGAAVNEQSVVADSIHQTLTAHTERGATVGVILDNPWVPFDPVECLGVERNADACRFQRDQGLRPAAMIRRPLEAALDQRPDLRSFDAADGICDRHWCDTQLRDGTLVFSDQTHLTPAYVRTQIPHLVEFLQSLIELRDSPGD